MTKKKVPAPVKPEQAHTGIHEESSLSGTGAMPMVKEQPSECLYSKEAKRVFECHSAPEVYITSDLQSFLTVQFARLHSESLKDKTIVTIKREEV